MQSRVALAGAPFPCRWVDRPAPSSSHEIQREARRPNARGRLSLNKTPMAKVTRVLVPPLGFRIICRRPHHQLLNVKQNPPMVSAIKPPGGRNEERRHGASTPQGRKGPWGWKRYVAETGQDTERSQGGGGVISLCLFVFVFMREIALWTRKMCLQYHETRPKVKSVPLGRIVQPPLRDSKKVPSAQRSRPPEP